MSHPRDLAAATDWIKSEVSPEFAREVGEALPSLPVGTAFVCSASLGIGQRGWPGRKLSVKVDRTIAFP